MILAPKLISKIHRVTVTDANKDYEGSITLGEKLCSVAGLYEYDMVHVNCIETGVHWETYVIYGEEGEVCLNGAAAHHFNVGDNIHILFYGYLDCGEKEEPIIIHCDEKNRVI